MLNGREPRSQSPGDDLWVCHLGTVEYGRALAAQNRVRALRQAGAVPDTLLLLEHPPVFTRGRRAGAGELLHDERFYRDRGVEILDTDRGGRVTYHGPGQLVGYPIMAVTDVVEYVRAMERAIVHALGEEGLRAYARPQDGPDFTGVWVRGRKIASIGVHVHRGVSTHGFAVNVDNELTPFTWVVACGLADVAMTSLAIEHGDDAQGSCEPALPCFRRRIAHSFCQIHGRRQRLVSPQRLGIEPLHTSPRRHTSPEPVPA